MTQCTTTTVTTYDSGNVSITVNGHADAVAEVEIEGLTGDYAKDAAMANKAAGLPSTPEGYVWHHVEDGKTMQLIPQSVHNEVRHTGGAAIIRNGGVDED